MNNIRYHVFQTDLGWMAAAGQGGRLSRVVTSLGPRADLLAEIGRRLPEAGAGADPVLRDAARQITEYARGDRTAFDLPLDWDRMTAFTRQVLEACAAIPLGQVLTYGALASAIGRPRAARAVGGAMSRNPIPIVIPCHRVVAGHGRLGGFSAAAGLDLKRRLLALEGIAVSHDRLLRRR